MPTSTARLALRTVARELEVVLFIGPLLIRSVSSKDNKQWSGHSRRHRYRYPRSLLRLTLQDTRNPSRRGSRIPATAG
jgi:hypothetical protein